MKIRTEQEQDRDGVHAVNIAAFETSSGAKLVDVLREQASPVISLVADDAGEACGHILFSPVTVSGHPDVSVMGLAPMAVLPERQNQGIGSALVRAGLDQCRAAGIAAVVVLGHSEYYPRFGFLPSTRFGIDSEYEVPEEVFMALELQSPGLAGISGTVKFHPAFSDV